jgi:hypothetical protein
MRLRTVTTGNATEPLARQTRESGLVSVPYLGAVRAG